jgi:diphthamide biosynthesis enzyme Dph1/Dph2-like protein
MSKILYIPAKVNLKLNKDKFIQESKLLPKTIAIAYSIQFKDIALETKETLSKNHKITSFCQVLGCSKPIIPKDTPALLLIGSGKFHAVSLAYETELPIYILEQNTLSIVSEKEINDFKTKKKAAYLRFLHSDNVGILISSKSGQQRLSEAIVFKKNLKNKKSYLFIADNINSLEFENFNIDSWINTACPRLDIDFRVLNLKDLENY